MMYTDIRVQWIIPNICISDLMPDTIKLWINYTRVVSLGTVGVVRE